jgi:hypothetical protein
MLHLISKLEGLIFVGNFIPKRNQILLYYFLVYFFLCSCGLLKLQTNWILGITSCHLILVMIEYVYFRHRVNTQVRFFADRIFGIATPHLAQSENRNELPVISWKFHCPEMHTFIFPGGGDVAIDLEKSHFENMKTFFSSFTSFYGIDAPGQKGRNTIGRAVDSKIRKNYEFLREMSRKHNDYNITAENFDEIVVDMTDQLRPYCDYQSFHAFKSQIAVKIIRGLNLCCYSDVEDAINILSYSKEFFFIVIFTLKICRTEKAFFLSYPAITGKFCSFLLKGSTSDLLKALEIDMEKNSKGLSGFASALFQEGKSIS